MKQSITCSPTWSIYQSMDKLTNQLINWSSNWSQCDKFINQLINESINWTINKSIYQPLAQWINRLINWPINWTIYQLTGQDNQSFVQWFNQLTNWSIIWSTWQSIDNDLWLKGVDMDRHMGHDIASDEDNDYADHEFFVYMRFMLLASRSRLLQRRPVFVLIALMICSDHSGGCCANLRCTTWMPVSQLVECCAVMSSIYSPQTQGHCSHSTGIFWASVAEQQATSYASARRLHLFTPYMGSTARHRLCVVHLTLCMG